MPCALCCKISSNLSSYEDFTRIHASDSLSDTQDEDERLQSQQSTNQRKWHANPNAHERAQTNSAILTRARPRNSFSLFHTAATACSCARIASRARTFRLRARFSACVGCGAHRGSGVLPLPAGTLASNPCVSPASSIKRASAKDAGHLGMRSTLRLCVCLGLCGLTRCSWSEVEAGANLSSRSGTNEGISDS